MNADETQMNADERRKADQTQAFRACFFGRQAS
jgi:hypothetical protein